MNELEILGKLAACHSHLGAGTGIREVRPIGTRDHLT